MKPRNGKPVTWQLMLLTVFGLLSAIWLLLDLLNAIGSAGLVTGS